MINNTSKDRDKIEELEIRIKHLRNQYDVVKEQYEKATGEYLNILDDVSQTNKQLQREIAEHETAEKALDKANIAIENSLCGVITADIDGYIIYSNNAAQVMWGYSDPNEMIGTHVLDYWVESEKNKAEEVIAVLIKESFYYGEGLIGKRKDGTEFITEIKAVIFNDESGKPKGMVGTFSDVTIRMQIEHELKKAKEYLQNIIDSSLDMIIAVDKNKCIMEFNKAACEIFGYSKEEIEGKHINRLFLRKKEGNKVSSQILKKGTFTGEVQNVCTNGRAFTSFLTAAMMFDEKGDVIGTVWILRDITNQIKSEIELVSSRKRLRALTEHLDQAREEERTNIAREIHDELGQALTALKMDVSWVMNKLPVENEALHEKLEIMSDLIDTMLKTTKEIIEELRPNILDYFGLEAAIDWYVKVFQKRTEIICEIHIDFKELEFDQTRSTTLFRIVQESLTNTARHANASRVKINIQGINNNLVLKVKDNGKGITNMQIKDPRSFGLIGMRERILLMKGKFKIHGVKNKGTTIEASIPLERRSVSR